MGAASSLIPDETQIKQIEQETGFTKEQLHRLYSRFIALDKQGEGRLRREDLERIPELYINPLSQFLLDAFFFDNQEINFKEFVRTLAIFRPVDESPSSACDDPQAVARVNSWETKMKFIFNIYDVDKDGVIKADEVRRLMEALLGHHEKPELVQAIADRIVADAVSSFNESVEDEAQRVKESNAIPFPAFLHAMKDVSDSQLSICFLN